MGKYPVDISEKENSKLKYPFLPTEQYDEIHYLPDGPVILIRYSKEKIAEADIAHMVEINRSIAARRIMKEQGHAANGK